MIKVILTISQRLILVKHDKKIQVCNYKDNYYGDQYCCQVEQLTFSQPQT